MLKRIGAEEGGEFKAVASGTLPSGKPVIVNTDGTVSVVEETTITDSVGTSATFTSATIDETAIAFDSIQNKHLIVFRDTADSYYAKAVVATVANDGSITFGSIVTISSAFCENIKVAFDSANGKFLVVFKNGADSNYGNGIVGTISGTSVSFGSATTIVSSVADQFAIAFDSNAGKFGVFYRRTSPSNQNYARTATISGTSVSFGTEVNFNASNGIEMGVAFDSTNNKFVVAYRDQGNSDYGECRVGTISGTDISFGTMVVFNSANTIYNPVVYDAANNKIVIAYRDAANSNQGTALVGTISGTDISFGSEVIFDSSGANYVGANYDSVAEKVVIAYNDIGDSNKGKIVVGTVSGTSISFGSENVFSTNATSRSFNTFDSNVNRSVIVYRDEGSTDDGEAVSFRAGHVSKNLTSENYIGMSRGAVFQTGDAASAGSTVTFNAASTSQNKDSSVFDSNSNKVVMAYQDAGNSDQGTAIVGTINNSDNSISFGSEVVFETGSTRHIASTFDTSNNKVVIAYRDNGNSNYGTAVVGTVSGTSISFGTPVVYNSGDLEGIGITFDSSNNKVVISYCDKADSSNGNAIVGTVSGTSISFGSEATFEVGNVDYTAATFDTSNNKVVISFSDKDNSNYGTAVVGTVSGTSISFGSAVVFASEYTIFNPIVFDSSNNKVVIAYREGAADHGKAVVGTVSGTSISFGTPVTFNSAAMSEVSATFDTNLNQVVIVYQDTGNSSKGTAIAGTVSGTSISFGSELVYQTGAVADNTVVYDSNANRFAVFYRDNGSPFNGKCNVFSTSTIATTRGEVSDGGQASIDIIGSVSDNHLSLTAGQQYFVQTDGTIGTTADSPSVLAGTAISATELLVKT